MWLKNVFGRIQEYLWSGQKYFSQSLAGNAKKRFRRLTSVVSPFGRYCRSFHILIGLCCAHVFVCVFAFSKWQVQWTKDRKLLARSDPLHSQESEAPTCPSHLVQHPGSAVHLASHAPIPSRWPSPWREPTSAYLQVSVFAAICTYLLVVLIRPNKSSRFTVSVDTSHSPPNHKTVFLFLFWLVRNNESVLHVNVCTQVFDTFVQRWQMNGFNSDDRERQRGKCHKTKGRGKEQN